MKSMSNVQIEEKNKHQADVATAHEKMVYAIEDFNDAKRAEWIKVSAAHEAYAEAVSNANEWRYGIQSDAQSYYDERSDKWKEGESGEQYSAWLDALGNEFETPDDIDEPEDIDIPYDVSEIIGEIAENPSEA